MPGQHVQFFGGKRQLIEPLSPNSLKGVEPACRRKAIIGCAKQRGADGEQPFAPIANPFEVRLLVQQGRPSIFKRGNRCAADAESKQFPCRRLQSWFRRWRACVETLKRLAPPCQADCTQCRLGR